MAKTASRGTESGQRLRRAGKTVQEGQTLASAVFASLFGHVAILDRDGRILAVNESWMRFARANNALIDKVGPGANYLDICRRATRAGAAETGRALAGIKAVLQGVIEEFTLEYRCAAGTDEGWFEMIVHPLRHPDGGAIVTHVNITKRRQAELEAQRLLQELSHMTRVSVMGEMTASLAHELNQPLTAILTNAQTAQGMLGHPGPDLGQLRDILADIIADDRRAAEVIRRVRSLLKKSAFDLQPLDLNEVIREMTGLMQNEALMSDILITIDLARDLPLVRGDRVQLQQVILNLLLNAFDALKQIPPGARKLSVRTFAPDAFSVSVSVQDSGPGIPEERLHTIFEPFVSSKPAGMGMGLSICRSIIRAHGGLIQAQNTPEGGAKFSVTLPV